MPAARTCCATAIPGRCCLGLEVVLPDGEVMNLMSELHKDNSGYDLKDLFIGAEGTLGVITAAVLQAVAPKPRAYATAMVALAALDPALTLLNRLQEATGGAVEAFEYMPRGYMRRLVEVKPELAPPLGTDQPVTILVEIGATAPRDAEPDAEGAVPVGGAARGAAGRDGRRGPDPRRRDRRARTASAAAMWAMREAAAEITVGLQPAVDNDICVPLDKVGRFLDQRRRPAAARSTPAPANWSSAISATATCITRSGPQTHDPALHDAIREMVEDVVQSSAAVSRPSTASA